MSLLARILRHEIETRGPIPFPRFLELALYHPDLGYYERAGAPIGRRGDYFTSVSVGSVFGELLGFHFARRLATLGDGPLQIVEAGAHEGELAADILAFLRHHEAALADRLEYWLLEPSDRRRARQRDQLARFAPQVRLAGDWREVPRVRGLIFSNELLDALPVHRLCWVAAERAWRASGVGWGEDRFVWTTLPGHVGPLDPSLSPELQAVLPDGYVLEVGSAAVAWWRQAAAALETGWLVTFDYGDGPGERFRPERFGGTLRAYRQHQASGDVLASPGEQDVTAHVDFGAIQAVGEAAGLQTEGLWRQETYVAGILAEIEQRRAAFPSWTPARLRQCQTLIHPAHLGTSFKVLVQSRATR